MKQETKKHVIARPVRKLVVAIRSLFLRMRIATSRFALLAMTWWFIGRSYFSAIASISQSRPLGRVFTATQLLAGLDTKYCS